MPFCNDIDLLHWEPALLKDATFAPQTLISGTGNLAGATFTISSGSFITAHVEAQQVIVLGGAIAGTFPIASVDSATQLTISVLYDGLLPESGPGVVSAVGTATGLTYTIRTFWAQRRIVSDLIQQAAGVSPGETAAAAITNPAVLRRVCALGTLQLIYSALAAAATSPEPLNARADLYERMYKRALRNASVGVDTDGDGAPDVVRPLNLLELQRA